MSEAMLIEHCAPTMAGLKTGNLFACHERGAALRECLRGLNRRLGDRGVRILPVCRQGERTLLYMYRPALLARDLRDGRARAILWARAYPVDHPARCVTELSRRLSAGGEFPHEVGLFLGYPAEDVEGFITHRAQDAKAVGVWKVYGDVEQAKRTFALYDKCKRVYRAAYDRMPSLERLVIRGHTAKAEK